MDKTPRIIAAIATERGLRNEDGDLLNVSEAEVLRYAVWRVWMDLGDGLADADMPSTMSSREWADACETVGIKRGTAMNRYSEARRNWAG
jgi:hypothetical protein